MRLFVEFELIQQIMEYINVGCHPNSGTADSITIAAEKINSNFNEIYNKIRINKPFKIVVWNHIGDTLQAMTDINDNYKIIEDHLTL